MIPLSDVGVSVILPSRVHIVSIRGLGDADIICFSVLFGQLLLHKGSIVRPDARHSMPFMLRCGPVLSFFYSYVVRILDDGMRGTYAQSNARTS
jgi:hypothetical protein